MTKTERKPAAILYAELRNFTRMSEMLEPERVLQLANEFFTLAARAADMCGGKVMWVQNDTLVIAFTSANAPQFAQQAFQAAQVVQREFGTVAEKWQGEYGLQVAFALGLHLGDTVHRREALRKVGLGELVDDGERQRGRAEGEEKDRLVVGVQRLGHFCN